MTLSSKSNTINALGIFGRLEPKQEKYFSDLQKKYSNFPKNHAAIGIFNHLSLVIENNVSIGKLPKYIDLLRDLKSFIPFQLKVEKVFVKDKLHLALAFDTKQTYEIRRVAKKFVPRGVVKTFYTKVVWFVPKNKQEEVETVLKPVKQMVFSDFILCANRQDEASTIYSSAKFKLD